MEHFILYELWAFRQIHLLLSGLWFVPIGLLIAVIYFLFFPCLSFVFSWCFRRLFKSLLSCWLWCLFSQCSCLIHAFLVWAVMVFSFLLFLLFLLVFFLLSLLLLFSFSCCHTSQSKTFVSLALIVLGFALNRFFFPCCHWHSHSSFSCYLLFVVSLGFVLLRLFPVVFVFPFHCFY